MQNIYLPLCGIEHFIDSHLNKYPWQPNFIKFQDT